MTTALVLHGHFYQPPRENPWTGEVDREPSAAPAHDWNERIHDECYRPNAWARIFDRYGRVERIVNNYLHLHFDFGPTLLTWLERRHPETYTRILDADRESARLHGGHGNAIGQAYSHAILPLCNERDLRTQIRWGIADFRLRFGRDPEALWLPETGAGDAVLDALTDEGMKYAILAPRQASRARPAGGAWKSVADGSIDPTVPYRRLHRDGSGRSIALFFYDPVASQAIAFEGSLASSQGLLDLLARRAPKGDGLVHAATDGESYGHHIKFGDLSLAYAMEVEAARRGFQVTNYGEHLERHPPESEVEIVPGEGTAWSCAHGVGRWARDCGCSTGGQEGWNQSWRAPLRAALDLLRDEAARRFDETRGDLFRDPWAARDEYLTLPREEILRRHAPRRLGDADQVRALTHLEIQRHTLLMYASCAWFFSDVSGVETLYALRNAARAIDLFEELGLPPPRERFLAALGEARSNLRDKGTAADLFRREVEPARVTPRRVAAHLAITGLVGPTERSPDAAVHHFRRAEFQKESRGRLTLSTAHIVLEHRRTARRTEWAACSMHMGGVDFYGVVKPYPGSAPFAEAAGKLWEVFATASLPTLLRLAQEAFGPDEFGLENLLPDGRQRVSELVFADLVARFGDQYALLYADNQRTLEMLQGAGFELPPELRAAAEFTWARRLQEEIKDPEAYWRAAEIVEEIHGRGLRIDPKQADRLFGETITEAVRAAVADPAADHLDPALSLLRLARKLGLATHLGRAQEAVHGERDRLPATAPWRELAALLGLAPSVLGGSDTRGPAVP